MSHLIIISLIIIISNFAGASTWEGQPDTIDYMPSAVYIPQGFDDNDNVQVVLEGVFPNNCFKTGPTEVKVDEDKKLIYVKNQVYYYKEAMCIQMRVPYEKVVDVGLIPKGGYKVVFTSGPETKVGFGRIGIEKATTKSPDNFLYAAVNNVDVTVDPQDRSTLVHLTGEFPNACMELKEVKYTHYEGTDVIQIMPITELKTAGCNPGEPKTFEGLLTVKGLASGRYLIHVRVLNGRSVNKIIRIK